MSQLPPRVRSSTALACIRGGGQLLSCCGISNPTPKQRNPPTKSTKGGRFMPTERVLDEATRALEEHAENLARQTRQKATAGHETIFYSASDLAVPSMRPVVASSTRPNGPPATAPGLADPKVSYPSAPSLDDPNHAGPAHKRMGRLSWLPLHYRDTQDNVSGTADQWFEETNTAIQSIFEVESRQDHPRRRSYGPRATMELRNTRPRPTTR